MEEKKIIVALLQCKSLVLWFHGGVALVTRGFGIKYKPISYFLQIILAMILDTKLSFKKFRTKWRSSKSVVSLNTFFKYLLVLSHHDMLPTRQWTYNGSYSWWKQQCSCKFWGRWPQRGWIVYLKRRITRWYFLLLVKYSHCYFRG